MLTAAAQTLQSHTRLPLAARTESRFSETIPSALTTTSRRKSESSPHACPHTLSESLFSIEAPDKAGERENRRENRQSFSLFPSLLLVLRANDRQCGFMANDIDSVQQRRLKALLRASSGGERAVLRHAPKTRTLLLQLQPCVQCVYSWQRCSTLRAEKEGHVCCCCCVSGCRCRSLHSHIPSLAFLFFGSFIQAFCGTASSSATSTTL